MSVLVTLARAGGGTVTRDDLINACWQGRVVSDDAIARSIAKVRALTKGVEPAPFTLETLPKVGYRLVAAQSASPPDPNQPAASGVAPPPAPPPPRFAGASSNPVNWIVGVSAVVALAAAAALASSLLPQMADGAARSAKVSDLPVEKDAPSKCSQSSTPPPGLRSADVAEALINLDERRVRAYLNAGWDPRWTIDPEGSQSLHVLMRACERDRAHDPQAVVRIARMLVEACADPLARNSAPTHDTPLVIAKHPKYCGPAHPVVAYLTTVELALSNPPVFAPPPAPAPGEPDIAQVLYNDEVMRTLRYLDERGVQAYLDAGWDPRTWMVAERNRALHILMEACERNPGHDREALVRLAKLLVANGADPSLENFHKDTPLDIAIADRFCKPDHPVVAYLKSLNGGATH